MREPDYRHVTKVAIGVKKTALCSSQILPKPFLKQSLRQQNSGQVTSARVTPGDSSDKDVVKPGTPAKLIGESRGGATVTLTMIIPKRLRLGPSHTPRAPPIVILSLEDLAW
jgi:hypothetical protein